MRSSTDIIELNVHVQSTQVFQRSGAGPTGDVHIFSSPGTPANLMVGGQGLASIMSATQPDSIAHCIAEIPSVIVPQVQIFPQWGLRV